MKSKRSFISYLLLVLSAICMIFFISSSITVAFNTVVWKKLCNDFLSSHDYRNDPAGNGFALTFFALFLAILFYTFSWKDVRESMK